MIVPKVTTLGVGAVVLAVPPVGTVYHCSVFPVVTAAVKTVPVIP